MKSFQKASTLFKELLNNTQDQIILSNYSRDLAPAAPLYLSRQVHDLEKIVDWEC